MYFAYMDKIKFCVVAAEDVSAFGDFQELALPHFLFFKDGKRVEIVNGCQGPKIEKEAQRLFNE